MKKIRKGRENMAKTILLEITPLHELSAEELRCELKNLKNRYKMAVSRYEFVYASDLKEDIRKVAKEMETRRRMGESV